MTAARTAAEQAEHEAVAQAALDKYASLPRRGKPKRRDNQVREWTVMAAVCLVKSVGPSRRVHCVSIGTGLKALPHSKLPVHGDVLHDSHAEVIARRGFHLWTYVQLERALRAETAKGKARERNDSQLEAPFFERSRGRYWRLRPEWRTVLYVSTLPCGDASTFLLARTAEEAVGLTEKMAATSLEPELPPKNPSGQINSGKTIPSLVTAASLGLSTARDQPAGAARVGDHLSAPVQVHRGRVSYSSFSCLRTKPGRADSPPTTSHSCSDKLAVWSLLGLQGALLSQLGMQRLPIDALVIGGVPEEHRERVGEEAGRAVGGRLEAWARSVGLEQHDFTPPVIHFTDRIFEHGREAVAADEGCDVSEVASCSESLSYVADLGGDEREAVEIINNGIRHGAPSRRHHPTRPLPPKARSRLCKLSLFERFVLVRQLANEPLTVSDSSSALLTTYYACKHAWTSATPSQTDPEPGERYQALKIKLRMRDSGPFAGWLVSGAPWESFDSHGDVPGTVYGGSKTL